jgi:hypothetical protein
LPPANNDGTNGAGVGLNAYPYYADNQTQGAYYVSVINATTFNICNPSATSTPLKASGTTLGSGGLTFTGVMMSRNSQTSCNFSPTFLSFAGTYAGAPVGGVYNEINIGRLYNRPGIELTGWPKYPSAIFPAIGQEFTIEIINDGSGVPSTDLAESPGGAHHMYINGMRQPADFWDRGGAGNVGANGLTWGNVFANLDRISFGGAAGVVSGAFSPPHNLAEVWEGRALITKSGLPYAIGRGLHAWCMN